MGSHCASKKAGFSGRQCSGLYLYPSSCPVAELFTITNSRRTRCLPEGPFSHGIYSRFLWDDLSIRIFLMGGRGGGKERQKPRIGWHSSVVPMQKSVVSSRHKRGKAPFLPGLYLPFSQVYAWETVPCHTELRKVIVRRGTYSFLAFFPAHPPLRQSRAKGNIKRRREVFPWLWNLTWIGFWLPPSMCVILSNLFEFSEPRLT